MLELGLRPRSFFSGNICFEFSVLCLCIAHLDDAGDNSAKGAASLSLLRAEDALQNSQDFTTGFYIETVYSVA